MIEPALGVNRSMLAFLVDAYDEEIVADRERTVLRLHPQLAPVKAAILPLIGKNEDMTGGRASSTRSSARVISVEYDDGGQIGRRYRRQDEIGTPWALTIDEQTLEDDTVTIRERDSLAQERISIARAREHLLDRLAAPWSSPKTDYADARAPASALAPSRARPAREAELRVERCMSRVWRIHFVSRAAVVDREPHELEAEASPGLSST